MIISISGRIGSGKDTAGSIIQELLQRPEGTNRMYTIWHIKKWAEPLRKVAAILLNMNEEFLYTEEFKQMVLPEIWSTYYRLAGNGEIVSTITMEEYIKLSTENVKCIPMTGREFLQKLGTDAIRYGLHDNSWVNALMSNYKPLDKLVFHGGNYYNLCYQCNKQFIGHKRQIVCKSCVDNLNIAFPNWIITDTRFPNELQAVKEHDGITICIKRNLQSNSARLHPSETALDKAEFDYIIDNNGTIEELKEKLILILKQHNLL